MPCHLPRSRPAAQEAGAAAAAGWEGHARTPTGPAPPSPESTLPVPSGARPAGGGGRRGRRCAPHGPGLRAPDPRRTRAVRGSPLGSGRAAVPRLSQRPPQAAANAGPQVKQPPRSPGTGPPSSEPELPVTARRSGWCQPALVMRAHGLVWEETQGTGHFHGEAQAAGDVTDQAPTRSPGRQRGRRRPWHSGRGPEWGTQPRGVGAAPPALRRSPRSRRGGQETQALAAALLCPKDTVLRKQK